MNKVTREYAARDVDIAQRYTAGRYVEVCTMGPAGQVVQTRANEHRPADRPAECLVCGGRGTVGSVHGVYMPYRTVCYLCFGTGRES